MGLLCLLLEANLLLKRYIAQIITFCWVQCLNYKFNKWTNPETIVLEAARGFVKIPKLKSSSERIREEFY